MSDKEAIDMRFWYLRDHDFFWEISNSDLKSLCVITGFKKAMKGDIIYFNQEETPRIYFLKRGALKIVSANNEGEEVIHDIIRRGDLFGQLLPDTNHSQSEEYAIALTSNVVICSFFASDFEALMIRKPNLALKFTKILAFKYKRIANSYNNLFFQSAKNRLLTFLNEWIQKEGKESGKGLMLENYLTQNDIAQVICATRQTAATLLNELENEGYIRYGRKEILIPDLANWNKMLQNVK